MGNMMADKKIATKFLRPEIQYWAKKREKISDRLRLKSERKKLFGFKATDQKDQHMVITPLGKCSISISLLKMNLYDRKSGRFSMRALLHSFH